MYLTSFANREQLFQIAQRWFWGKPAPSDALNLTRIFISDGYVLGETVESVIGGLVGTIHPPGFQKVRIRSKGELRDALCRRKRDVSPRVEYLFECYRKNPEYFYYETPISGVLCLDESGQLLATYRLKRPKRIAEKANRRIANWIFQNVQEEAMAMAQVRATTSGIPLERLLTPEAEMVREFVAAEEIIANSFRQGAISFDRSALTINDVGGIKIFGAKEQLAQIESKLRSDPSVNVTETENFYGNYEATSLLLDIIWNSEAICRKYKDLKCWEKYVNRGIPEFELKKGLDPWLESAEPRIRVELILSTFEAMVESELGHSIHEERIIAQRDHRAYKGYIPMNVEFLLEYLFAVGFSPAVQVQSLPIKLWGRYLSDTLVIYIRQLYQLPQYDLFY